MQWVALSVWVVPGYPLDEGKSPFIIGFPAESGFLKKGKSRPRNLVVFTK
jgi:hypothetical protein